MLITRQSMPYIKIDIMLQVSNYREEIYFCALLRSWQQTTWASFQISKSVRYQQECNGYLVQLSLCILCLGPVFTGPKPFYENLYWPGASSSLFASSPGDSLPSIQNLKGVIFVT